MQNKNLCDAYNKDGVAQKRNTIRPEERRQTTKYKRPHDEN